MVESGVRVVIRWGHGSTGSCRCAGRGASRDSGAATGGPVTRTAAEISLVSPEIEQKHGYRPQVCPHLQTAIWEPLFFPIGGKKEPEDKGREE